MFDLIYRLPFFSLIYTKDILKRRLVSSLLLPQYILPQVFLNTKSKIYIFLTRPNLNKCSRVA